MLWVAGMCGSLASPRNPDGEKKSKTNLPYNKNQEFLFLNLLTDNTWLGAWPGPSNPRPGPQKWRTSPYRARVSWALPPMSWAGPGRLI